ncbi:MAG TPA: AI-2E family transporter, partial [Elusimicrobiota bacterium]|nr:AI-2E family transporter [Elusimicrobiota bacterium]
MNIENSSDRRTEARPLLFRIFFFASFGFLLYQLLRIVSPFLEGILVAITLALVFYPVHTRFLRWTRGRTNLAAGASVGALFLIVIVPAAFFLGLLGQQAAAVYPWAQNQVQEIRQNPNSAIADRLPAPVKKIWTRAQDLLVKEGINPEGLVLNAVEVLGRRASSMGAAVVKNVFLLLFQTVIMVFTLYFIFRDGARLSERVVSLIPMESAYKSHILGRLNQTLTAVVRGMFITATVQGILAGIGFAVAGVGFSVVLGFATAFFALVPFVGAGVGPIWYRLRQSGEFVDTQTLDIFEDEFESSGWSLGAAGFGGADISVTPRYGITVEGRYLWAKGAMNGDFSTYNKIDLSGYNAS